MSTATAGSMRWVWTSTATEVSTICSQTSTVTVSPITRCWTARATSPTTGRAPGRSAWTARVWAHSLLGDCGGSGSTASSTAAGRSSSTAAGPTVDLDGDGQSDDRLLDVDGNGLADRALSGQVGYVDSDGDGRWDIKLTDSNNDGKADAANDL